MVNCTYIDVEKAKGTSAFGIPFIARMRVVSFDTDCEIMSRSEMEVGLTECKVRSMIDELQRILDTKDDDDQDELVAMIQEILLSPIPKDDDGNDIGDIDEIVAMIRKILFAPVTKDDDHDP